MTNTTPPAVVMVPRLSDEQRIQLRDAVSEAIGADAYFCTRVWNAWNVGTMDQNDFTPVVEDDAAMDGIVDAIEAALQPTPQSLAHGAEPVAQRVRVLLDGKWGDWHYSDGLEKWEAMSPHQEVQNLGVCALLTNKKEWAICPETDTPCSVCPTLRIPCEATPPTEAQRLDGVDAPTDALREVRRVLELENNKPNGAIVDTIWRGPGETLFDFIDNTLAAQPTQQGDAQPDATEIERVVETAVSAVWKWGESFGIDDVSRHEEGDSHNEGCRHAALKAVDDVYALIAHVAAHPVVQAPAEPERWAPMTHAAAWLTNNKPLHPLTINLVVRFARALASKLSDAEGKYGYSDGWRSADWIDECRAKLAEHVAKGDPRDVAAYCAFLWHHGESTAVAGVQAPVEPARIDLHGLDTDERVCFYEQDFYVLSNFSSFELLWGGYRYATSEHAYHVEKFRNHRGDIADQIACAPSAHEAFKIAERHKADRIPEWDEVKVGIMRSILRAKVQQHEYVRRKLLATGGRELVENSWRDDFWGWGPNRDGQNMLGKLWMEIRAELLAAHPAQPREAGDRVYRTGSGGQQGKGEAS